MAARRKHRRIGRLSVGWTQSRGPWIQFAGRRSGRRGTGWFGGREYLRRRRS
jgi:hypothetical protein